MSTPEPGTTPRRVAFLAAGLVALWSVAACHTKTPDVTPPSDSASGPATQITPFPGSCTTGWPYRYAAAFASPSTDQVGPSSGSGLDSLTCAFSRNYRDLPTVGQLSINLWRLDAKAGHLAAASAAEALIYQADQDLRAICVSASTSPTAVPGTRSAKKCLRGHEDGVVIGVSVTTDIAAVTVRADAEYQSLNHDQVDGFLDKLTNDTLTQAVNNLQSH
jgi:hypothetical protein